MASEFAHLKITLGNHQDAPISGDAHSEAPQTEVPRPQVSRPSQAPESPQKQPSPTTPKADGAATTTAPREQPAKTESKPKDPGAQNDNLFPLQKYIPNLNLHFLGEIFGPTVHKEEVGEKPPVDKPELTPEQKAIQDYVTAKDFYKKNLDKYWDNVETMKERGLKINDFPATYNGPAKPRGYEEPPTEGGLPTVKAMVRLSRHLGRIADHDPRVPDFEIKDVDEHTFTENYVREALNLAKTANFAPEQMQPIVEKVYKFECGGRAYHDTLSGVPYKFAVPDEPGTSTNQEHRRSHRPISTGLGFNQLLSATTMRHVQNDGKLIADRLRELAKDSDRPAELNEKARLVENLQKVIDQETAGFAHKARRRHGAYYDNNGKPLYSLFQDLAASKSRTAVGLTGRQLASAIQALNIDGDIGPVIQSRQVAEVLSDSLKPEVSANLQKKIDMDGERARQFDELSDAQKQRAVNELFAIAGGGKHNPAADSLKEKIKALPAGLSDGISRENLTVGEYNFLNDRILEIKRAGGRGSALSEPTRKLLDKVKYDHYGAPTVDRLRPAYVELANLVGTTNANRMIRPDNLDASTVNFFSRQGYHVNSIVQRRSSGELLDAIFRRMERTTFKNGSASASAASDNAVEPPPGIRDFEAIFYSALPSKQSER